MTEDPVDKCEKCGGKVKRLIGTGAGLIFKGNGFYATDYRSKDYKTSAAADSPSTSVPETKADKKGPSGSASKPAKKDESL